MGWLLVLSLLLPVVVVAMACSIVGAKIFQNKWEGPYQEGLWPCLDLWDIVRLRTSSSYWNVPGKYGPYSELFFLIKKEPVALTGSAIQARCSRGNAQGGCADWSARVLFNLWRLFAGAGMDSRAQWSKVPSVERRCAWLGK